jgi:hypothetical protein
MDELDRAIATVVRKPGHRPVVELVDEEMVSIFAAMSGAERLAMAAESLQFARQLVGSSVRAAHPDWDEQRVAEEVARRFLGGVP